MEIMGIRYATREQVQRVGDIRDTARSNAQIDRLLDSATPVITGITHRRFWPELTSRSFDWPNRSSAPSWQFWLGSNELISLSSVVSGGVTIAPSGYSLRRADGLAEAPYTYLELNTSTSAAFSGGSNPRASLALTGLYGYQDVNRAVTVTASSMDAVTTAVTVADSSQLGTGSLIRLGAERLIVTRLASLTTGQALTADLASSAGATLLTVADSSAIHADEVITIGAERMLVEDAPTATTVIVRRGWSGSVLAAHAATDVIYAPRSLTVERATLGTTAAAHGSAVAVELFMFPATVSRYAIAYAIDGKAQEDSGFARTVGSGDSERESTGRTLRTLRSELYVSLGRQQRSGAI